MPSGRVEVWFAFVPPPPDVLVRLRRLLSESELARASRFVRQLHRDRFVATRAIRRLVLASYLGVPAASIIFESAEVGKPAVAGQGAAGLRFNESESSGLAAYAVAQGVELGVDVEYVGTHCDGDRTVEMFGTDAERRSYRALPPEARHVGFYRWWTAKEAYLKAVGAGLRQPLDSFSVVCSADAVALVEIAGDPVSAAQWTTTEIAPASGWVGTLVMAGPRPPQVDVRWWGRGSDVDGGGSHGIR